MNGVQGALLFSALTLMACRGGSVLRPVKLEVVEAVSQSWEPVVGPDHWTHETGMELTIPEGWRGTHQEAPILEIEHTDLKVAVTIAEAAGPLETPNPWQLLRERHPCERFAGMDDCTTWTEREAGDKGRVREVWVFGAATGTYVLQVVYPFGNVVAGTALANELLAGFGVSRTVTRSSD